MCYLDDAMQLIELSQDYILQSKKMLEFEITSTLRDFEIHPFAILWYKPRVIQEEFLGSQNAAVALTSWDQINEDWRFPKM